jgi:hypothetical protein
MLIAMDARDDLVAELMRMFPDHTPGERYVEWQRMTLALLEMGIVVVTVRNGRLHYTHIQNATARQKARALTSEQYGLWMEPAASGVTPQSN